MNSFNVALINIILLPAIVSRCVGNCQQMCWQLSADVSAIVSRCVGNCQQMCWQLSTSTKKYFFSPLVVCPVNESITCIPTRATSLKKTSPPELLQVSFVTPIGFKPITF